MNTLHHVATGLEQLHRADIAHQDLKPSNVLVFGDANGSKICDLGRAWDRHAPSPHDGFPIAGDTTYAPPELLYDAMPTAHQARRFGCDMYHLGSLTVFLFARAHTTALITDNLAVEHRPLNWGGTYPDVLPFVQAAFDAALVTFAEHVPTFLRSEMERIVAEMCNPDPSRRGHPRNRGCNQFSLERYISRFNYLSHKARFEMAN